MDTAVKYSDRDTTVFKYEDRSKFDTRHGGAFDRGSADSYYGRAFRPHFYIGGTGMSPEVTELNEEQLEDYRAGYEWNERFGDKKDYGV